MKIIEPGHIYELANLDGEVANTLTFVLRSDPPAKYPGNRGAHPGCIMQEVLRALIDRARYVDGQFNCVETRVALNSMRNALYQLEKRAARLHGDLTEFYRRVESDKIEQYPTCPLCGHISHPSRHQDVAWHQAQRAKLPEAPRVSPAAH